MLRPRLVQRNNDVRIIFQTATGLVCNCAAPAFHMCSCVARMLRTYLCVGINIRSVCLSCTRFAIALGLLPPFKRRRKPLEAAGLLVCLQRQRSNTHPPPHHTPNAINIRMLPARRSDGLAARMQSSVLHVRCIDTSPRSFALHATAHIYMVRVCVCVCVN